MSKTKKVFLFLVLLLASVETHWQMFRVRDYCKNWYKNYDTKHLMQDHLYVRFCEKEKKKFVFVITSYNNEKYCERNLLSVFDQDYESYRVLFINDCSTDKTVDKVRAFVDYKKKTNCVTIIDHKEKRGKTRNLFEAYQMCKNDEIIVCLDGDDSLAHDNVLKELNTYYQNPDVWVTYGSAILMPQAKKLIPLCFTDKEKKRQKMRKMRFDMHMLRTFYAGLVKKLSLEDFMYKGDFLPSADDFQIMNCLFEMAPSHVMCLYDINYIINDLNPNRSIKIASSQEVVLAKHLKQREKKKCLDEKFDPRVEDIVAKSKYDAKS